MKRADETGSNIDFLTTQDLLLSHKSSTSIMQFVANKAQEAMGPAPGSEVQNDYAHRPGGETMRALAWFGWAVTQNKSYFV